MNRHHHRAHYKLQPSAAPQTPAASQSVYMSPWNTSAPIQTTSTTSTIGSSEFKDAVTKDSNKDSDKTWDTVKKVGGTALCLAFPEVCAAYYAGSAIVDSL